MRAIISTHTVNNNPNPHTNKNTYLRTLHLIALHEQRAETDGGSLDHEVLLPMTPHHHSHVIVHQLHQRLRQHRVARAGVDETADQRGGVADVRVVRLEKEERRGHECRRSVRVQQASATTAFLRTVGETSEEITRSSLRVTRTSHTHSLTTSTSW